MSSLVKGKIYSYRDYSGETFSVVIIKVDKLFSLMQYRVHNYDYGYEYTTTKRLPNWRIIK